MPRIVPEDWMPSASMKRIHLHWTAGGHTANSTDKRAYHILVQGDGTLVRGNHSIKANERNLTTGNYAAHTASANTGAIGVSLCCMAGAEESPFHAGSHPMTATQWKAGLKVIADLAERYGIIVAPTTILTHAEVEPTLNIKQRNKWDIVRLAFDPSIKGHRDVGDEMRRSVAVLMNDPSSVAGQAGDGQGQAVDPNPDDEFMPEDMRLPKFRVSGVSPSRLNFRRSPSGIKAGSLPERSQVERIGVFDEWWFVRTSKGYVGYVHSSFLTPVS